VQRIADRIAIIKKGALVAEDTVDGLRRTAPQKMEVRFPYPVDLAELSTVKGVTVIASDGPLVTLDVTGEIAPVLKIIASHDPVDLISRPAGLDELFLGFYRDSPDAEVPHAR
jgi:beta-exotoxin I transport system ATP-binding protein